MEGKAGREVVLHQQRDIGYTWTEFCAKDIKSSNQEPGRFVKRQVRRNQKSAGLQVAWETRVDHSAGKVD